MQPNTILAHQIAEHLPGWEADTDARWITLRRPADGAEITLRRQDGRLRVFGSYPSTVYVHEPQPSITLAADRPPRTIAAEITRRFLPGYDATYTKASQQAQELEHNRAYEIATCTELAQALGATFRPYEHSGMQDAVSMNVRGINLTFHVSGYSQDVRIARAEIPIDLFRRLAPVIRTWTQEDVEPEWNW